MVSTNAHHNPDSYFRVLIHDVIGDVERKKKGKERKTPEAMEK